MGSKDWIEKMHMKKGAFKAQAQRAGESTAKFAKEKDDAPGKTGRRARLAEKLMAMRKK